MDKKTEMNERQSAIEFVKEHSLSRYSFDEFIKLLNQSGFAVEDFRSERAKKFYSLLDTKPCDSDSFFLCNKNGIKVVFINAEASDDVKCHRIAVLFYFLNSEDSRFCSEDEFVSANRFAVYLEDVLSTGLSISDKYSFLNKYGKTALTAILCIFVIIMGLFINNVSDKSQNPLENGIYISNESNNDIFEGENLSVNAFAESAVDFEFDKDFLHDQPTTVTENIDTFSTKPFEQDRVEPSKPISLTVIDDKESDAQLAGSDSENVYSSDAVDEDLAPQLEVVVPDTNFSDDKENAGSDASDAEVVSDDQLQTDNFDSDIVQDKVEILLPNEQVIVLKDKSVSDDGFEPDNSLKNDAEAETEYVIHTEDVYYVTKSGKKYHLQGCSYIKDLTQCTAIPKNEIPNSSFEPCKRCIK